MSSNQENAATNPGISDSWVDLTGQCSSGTHSPRRVTPIPFGEADYLRMLREAQRESNRSSCKVSPISSAIMSLSSTTRNTPSASPKSPPNSPNPELAAYAEELRDVYINRLSDIGSTSPIAANAQPVTASELIWDWNSRPNVPPKDWRLPHSVRSRKSSGASRLSCGVSSPKDYSFPEEDEDDKTEKQDEKSGPGGFSKKFFYTIVLTNIISLIIGAGVGMWFNRKATPPTNLIAIGL